MWKEDWDCIYIVQVHGHVRIEIGHGGSDQRHDPIKHVLGRELDLDCEGTRYGGDLRSARSAHGPEQTFSRWRTASRREFSHRRIMHTYVVSLNRSMGLGVDDPGRRHHAVEIA